MIMNAYIHAVDPAAIVATGHSKFVTVDLNGDSGELSMFFERHDGGDALAALVRESINASDLLFGVPDSAEALAAQLCHWLDQRHADTRRRSATLSNDGTAVLVDSGTDDQDHRAFVIEVREV